MFKTIRSKLLSILIIFSLFIFLSFSLSYSLVQNHDDYEKVIDLIESGVFLVNKINEESINPPESSDPAREIQQFEELLRVLEEGGTYSFENQSNVQVEALGNDGIYVAQIRTAWDEYLKALNELGHPETFTAEYELAENSLLSSGNEVIAAIYALLGFLEEHSDARHNRLLWMNVLFMGLSLPILGLSFYLINTRISKPLEYLARAAQLYRQGKFEQAFSIEGDNEIKHLAQAFDEMKLEIQEHQATLENEISDRIREISTAFEFSQDIVSQLELGDLLASATEKVKSLLQAKVVTICLVDQESKMLTQVASTNRQIGSGLTSQAVDTRNLFVWKEQGKANVEQVWPGKCALIDHLSPLERCFATPLRVGQQVIGEICIVRVDTEALGENEKRALILLANSIAVAIQNTLLLEQSRQQALENARLSERERLASDLHDNLAQTISTLNRQAVDLEEKVISLNASQVPREVKDIRENLDIALEQMRLAISGYSVTMPVNGNSWKEFLQYLDEFKHATGIQIQVSDSEAIMICLPGLIQKQIVFILREALTNIKKHAKATRVEITLVENHAGVEVKISDDGIGFDPGSNWGDHHLGLQIMQARAVRTGGKLVIRSEIGKGTHITAHFPHTP